MIFYFTGTGNSLYAAQKLADEGEQIVSVVDALRSKAFRYTRSRGRIGIRHYAKQTIPAESRESNFSDMMH